MSRARSVAAGAAWIYGAQLVTVFVQFAYAAVTSRQVDDVVFGAYAVALSVSSMVALVANGGIGQTVGRMKVTDQRTLRALVLLSTLLGFAGAAFLLLSAPLWAWIWGIEAAVEPIRWVAVSAFVAPFLGLATGLMRREGRFRSLAQWTVITNVFGMFIGAVAVIALKSPSALLASPIVAQVGLALAATALTRRSLAGFASLRHARGELIFSWQVTVQNLANYLNVQTGYWVTSRFFSPALLGQWNRTDIVTTIPFQQVQNAMIQAAYPEFRHDIDDSRRAREVWPDLLGAVAWVALPVAGIGAFVVPPVVPLLFGPGWDLAAQLATPLMFVGGLQVVCVLLASAVEALGRYRWVWAAIAVRFALILLGAAAASIFQNFAFVISGIAAGLLGLHIANIIACVRGGYIELARLLRHYLGAVVATIVVSSLTWSMVIGLQRMLDMPWLLGLSVLGLVTLAAVLWHFRKRLPPIQLAHRYGLIR